ncbi:MAG: Flp pilus assembly protein CpaB [Lentisphaeria bacterium]|nr:Flp pilus assembly protein CpaB [Lentisphaeria bacterium]
MKQKLLLLGAVFFGVLAFMFTFHQINLEKSKIRGEAQDVYLIQVVRDLAENEKITEDAIREIKVRRFRNAMETSALREIEYDRKNMVIGREVRSLIQAGSILQWTDLKTSLSSGRSGLTALVRPGYRAISIAVDSTSSVTGLVQPNNYVDLIGTFRFPDARGDSSLDTITLTILQRVRVIATGTDMGVLGSAGNQDVRARGYSTVTLELTPKEVEMIIFASQKGRLHLSLRNYEESAITKELQNVNWNFLQKNISNYTREREEMMKQGR